MASCLLTHLGAQRVVETLPVSAVTPLAKIPVHTGPLGILMREHAPFDAPVNDIKDGIDHRPHIELAVAPARFGWWDQISDKIPFGISKVCRVWCGSHPSSVPNWCHLWATFQTASKEFAAPHRSETARRMTNLLQACRMLEFPQTKGSVFLQDGLIHRTSKGLAVRSKSELIIAEALSHAGVAFEYEKPLTLGGSTRYPDFTIDDEISGRTVYWEHLGLLEREDYRRSWEKKLAWYRANGVLPAEEGVGTHGILVTTSESSTAGFDSSAIQTRIAQFIAVCGA
jgi:hypothetical protein